VQSLLETIFRSLRYNFPKYFFRIMRMINPVFNSFRIRILFFYLLPRQCHVTPPPRYDRRSFTVEKIGVRIGMYGGDQRYRNASCPFNINEMSCLSHVRPARQVTFCVFRPEKLTPTEKPYISVRCASGATTSILFSGKCGKLRNRWSTR
jgi:hypothetical protein